MKDVELYDPAEGDMVSLDRLAQLLFLAAHAAIDEDQQEITRLLINGKPMAVIAPYRAPTHGVQFGNGNVQSNTFG